MSLERDTELGLLASMAESLEKLERALVTPGRSGPPLRWAPIRVVAAGAGVFEVIPPSTRRLNVVGVLVVNREAVDVTFLAGTHPLTGAMPLPLNGGFSEGFKSRDVPVFPGLRGEELNVAVSGATTLGGVVVYFED